MNKTVTESTHEDAIPLPISGKAAALATGGMNFIDGAMWLSGSLDNQLYGFLLPEAAVCTLTLYVRFCRANIFAYLLGLLAMIKCSICSYQCEN